MQERYASFNALFRQEENPISTDEQQITDLSEVQPSRDSGWRFCHWKQPERPTKLTLEESLQRILAGNRSTDESDYRNISKSSSEPATPLLRSQTLEKDSTVTQN